MYIDKRTHCNILLVYYSCYLFCIDNISEALQILFSEIEERLFLIMRFSMNNVKNDMHRVNILNGIKDS